MIARHQWRFVHEGIAIKEGQTVKKDEIIVVMANYPAAEVGVKIAENNS